MTTMIITGGSAILRAYFESAAGKVREAPKKLRSRARNQVGSFSGYPEARHNFFVRFRNALSWFSYLPQYRRRSILSRGLVAAVGAFVIGMALITLTEFGIGNSFSCGFWGTCPTGAVAGVHLDSTRTGAEPSALLARPKTNPGLAPVAAPTQGQQKGLFENLIPGSNNQQSTPQPVPGQQPVPDQQPTPGQPVQPAPGQPVQPSPGQPAQPSQPAQPAPGGVQPQPAQPAQPQPAQPAQPTPAPGGQSPAAPAPAPSGGGAGQQQPSSP